MKKMLFIIIVFCPFKMIFGQEQIEVPVKHLNSKFNRGEKVYLKRINYFEYDKNNFVVDSIDVVEDKISIVKRNASQELLVLSTFKDVPLPYLPLRKTKKRYTWMFCSNFYTTDNFLILEDQFNKAEYEYFNKFYKEFTKNSLDKNLFKGGNYIDLSVDKALERINIQKENFENDLNKLKSKFSPKFVEYIQTEISLGAFNQFLNWYEVINENLINVRFKKENKSDVHDKIYEEFIKKRWNSNSIQYYRIIERVLNYQESKRRKEFNTYFEHIEDKKKKTEQIVKKTRSNNV